MNKILKLSAAIAAMLILWARADAQEYIPAPENLQAREKFQDDKFGIFVHWGLYSMLGQGEWEMNNHNLNYKEYPKLAGGFYPSRFDADEWVRIFKDAGAKYVTITSRHHDGFSMFKTKASPYNIVDATPFGRDVIGELAQACAKEGITLNFYYSHLDWGRLDYPMGRTGRGTGRPTDQQNWDSYFAFMNAQLTELLEQYHPGALWFDGFWDHDEDAVPFDWHYKEQYALIHKISPACLIVNNHHQLPYPGEDVQTFEKDLPGENFAGLSGQGISNEVPIETSMTMNDSWGYRIVDKNYKSVKTIIDYMVKAAGVGGNFLLNVGPRPDGCIPQEAVERLAEVGKWMEVYGETIYGTRAGLIKPHEWGATTLKGDKLYVHILSLKDSTLFLPLEGRKVLSATGFKEGEKIPFEKTKDGVILSLPKSSDEMDYVIEIQLALK